MSSNTKERKYIGICAECGRSIYAEFNEEYVRPPRHRGCGGIVVDKQTELNNYET